MAKVTVSFNGRTYDIACGAGEEGRVQDLAGDIRRRMEALAKSAGAMQEPQLFAVTALLLADELDQRRRELDQATREREMALAALRNQQDAEIAALKAEREAALAALRGAQVETAREQERNAEARERRIADTIARLAERIETLAARLAAA